MGMLKLADNPPIRSPEVGSVAGMAGRWWVAHTKARNEKAFARDLLRRGIAYFLPMRERIFFSGGRKRRGMMPLFTSYVFFCGDDRDRYTALTTHRICRTLDVFDQAGLVGELAAIEQALAGRAPLEPYPRLAIGRRCRVAAGPFEGIEGVVVERARSARLVIEVALLKQGVAMEIDTDLLEPVDSP
jgi:transcriptional antiterminator RfaH